MGEQRRSSTPARLNCSPLAIPANTISPLVRPTCKEKYDDPLSPREHNMSEKYTRTSYADYSLEHKRDEQDDNEPALQPTKYLRKMQLGNQRNFRYQGWHKMENGKFKRDLN